MSSATGGNISVGKGFTSLLDNYDIGEGGPQTVGAALDKFVAGNGGAKPELKNVKVNNRPATSLDQKLEDGDFVLIMDSAVQRGGLKGA